MILEIIEGIMINSSCEYVVELGSGGEKTYYGLPQSIRISNLLD